MDKTHSKGYSIDLSYLRSHLTSKPDSDLHITLPLSSKKNSLGIKIRHPYICSKCRRLKLQGFHGSFPPKNFCICPPDTFLQGSCVSPITLRLPSAPLKNFVATGTAIYSRTSEFSATDLALTRIANIIKSSNSPVDKTPELISGKLAKFKFLVYPGNNSKLVKSILEQRVLWTEGNFSNSGEAQFIWQPTSKNVKFIRLAPYLPPQFINHFECHGEISNKSNLFVNLNGYCVENELSVFEMMPMTFSVDFKSKRLNSQIGLFVGFFKAVKGEGKVSRDGVNNVPNTHFIGQNVWLIKPADFNRGRGIRIFNTLESFKTILSECTVESHNRRDSSDLLYVIQKYIENPLLIDNRKFDIRVWVLVTHKLNCYFYKDGYIRTSSEHFSLEDSLLSNQFIHLTNNAVQKESKLYGKYELGNQISFTAAQDYFDKVSPGKVSFTALVENMKVMIGHTLNSVKKKLNPNNREFCFEIFGFDFIVDCESRIWLIECNTNPCIELSSPLLEKLIPKMINDAFVLTIDTFFVPSQPRPTTNSWEFLQSLKK